MKVIYDENFKLLTINIVLYSFVLQNLRRGQITYSFTSLIGRYIHWRSKFNLSTAPRVGISERTFKFIES